MIDVKNLSKSFGKHLVLDDISEHISPGEKVVVEYVLRLGQVHLFAVPEFTGESHGGEHYL